MRRPNGVVPPPARGVYAKVGTGPSRKKRRLAAKAKISSTPKTETKEEELARIDRLYKKRTRQLADIKAWEKNNPRPGPRILPDLTKKPRT